jgi:putative salt-induced outer membrane protein
VRDDAIGRAAVSFKRKLSANTELSNSLVGESGGANTFTQNELGATVKVSDKLALKAGLQLRRNSAVADGAERTDTLATTNIVFGF